MPEPYENVWRWPVSRYLREVVGSQPEGRILLHFGKLNLSVGLVLLLSRLFFPLSPHLSWVHVVLFLGMPMVGFLWFVRNMPSLREPWQRKVDALFQLLPALFPWFAIVESHVR